MSKTLYCLGFCFSRKEDYVVLIQKQRPNWQKGKLNGIGGHIMEDETAIQAMVREFEEETNFTTEEDGWIFCGTLEGKSFNVSIYATNSYDPEVASVTDEAVYVLPIDKLQNYLTIRNVPALIHLCLCKLNDPSLERFTLLYNN